MCLPARSCPTLQDARSGHSPLRKVPQPTASLTVRGDLDHYLNEFKLLSEIPFSWGIGASYCPVLMLWRVIDKASVSRKRMRRLVNYRHRVNLVRHNLGVSSSYGDIDARQLCWWQSTLFEADFYNEIH